MISKYIIGWPIAHQKHQSERKKQHLHVLFAFKINYSLTVWLSPKKKYGKPRKSMWCDYSYNSFDQDLYNAAINIYSHIHSSIIKESNKL